MNRTGGILLRTLGELRLEGVDPALSGRRKELVLTAFLVRNAPRAFSRDELSSLLWEDRDRGRARQSLRQALLELRRGLGAVFVIEDESIAIDPSLIRLDVNAVEADLDAGRYAGAVEAWRGEFLPGTEDLGGESFRGWLEGERASLRARIRAAFVRLTSEAASAGAWREAAEWAERWAGAFPLDEDAHRHLAEALNLGGRQAAAMSRLAAYCARVQVELGVSPSPAILALRSTIERSLPTSPRTAALGSAALFTPDVVGRDAALAELAAAWTEAKNGSTVTMVVEAESGMGRTRVVEEFARRVRQSGDGVVLHAKGHRTGEVPAWNGLRELLEGMDSAPGLGGATPQALATLSEFAPALRSRFPSLSAGADADRSAALADVLGAIGEERALLLILDDLPRIDTATIELVVGAVARPIKRLLFIATMATDDAAIPAAREHLRRLGMLRRLKLLPLDVSELEGLLDSMLKLTATDRRKLAERLHVEGGGSPFYAVEMTSALVDEGLLSTTEEGGWRLAASGDWSFPRPASLREALTRRVTRLAPHAREVAEAAAVMDGARDRETLRRMSGLPTATFDAALEDLVAAKIMRPSRSDGGYDFTQDVTTVIVSDMMSPARRRALARAGTARSWRKGWLVAAAVFAGVGVVTFVRHRETPALDPQLALAAPLRNGTGDPALDPIGDLAADWITQGIAQSGVLHVVSPLALRASIRVVKTEAPGADRESRVAALAQETGAGTVIGGSYYRAGDSLVFQIRITDANNGRVLSAPDPVRGGVTDPSRALDVLRERAVAALAVLFSAQLGGMSQNASHPPSFAAYKEFVQGLDLHVRYRYSQALEHYRRAHVLDSTFASPLVWSALAYWSFQDYARTDSMLRLAESFGDRLSRFDALLAANQRGELDGDYSAALSAAEEMTRVSSGSEAFILVGQESLRLNRPCHALEAFRRANPDRGWIKGWEGYWGFLAFASHRCGHLEEALRAAREGRRRYPTSSYTLTYEAGQLAALHRMTELNATLAEAESRPGDAGWPPAMAMLGAAIELRAHGHPDEAKRMAERGLRSLDTRPLRPGEDPLLELQLAHQAEAWDTLARLAEALPTDSTDDGTRDGYLGLVAASRGDTAEATRHSANLAALRRPYSYGNAEIWRATIAARSNRKDEAVRLLRSALAEGVRADALSHDMELDALRGFRPYDELVRPAD